MNFSNSSIEKLSVHYVGNKLQNEPLISSKKQLHLQKSILEKLSNYFLSKFQDSVERFSFEHPSALKYNEVYNFCKEIFTGEKTFQAGATDIASHLYEQSVHPKVIGGQLYVCLFKDCIVDNNKTNAIGIFKTENKTGFFEINDSIEDFSIVYKEGLDLTKLDKGCVIFNKEVRDGYVVAIVDSQSKGHLAQYWKDDFLNVKEKADNYHFTKNYLSVAKDFIVSDLEENFQLSKADKADLLNRSINYFKENSAFNADEFEETVFKDSSIIKSFQQFGAQYLEDNALEISDTFEISTSAVKKQARVFKSVLKLDKNFHIYIHGDKNLIERGFDKERKMNFYKVYFNDEQ